MKLHIVFFALFVILGCQPDVNSADNPCSESKEAKTKAKKLHPSLQKVYDNPDFVDVSNYPHVKVELRYATENNFMKTNVYGEFTVCFLHKEAATKLKKATQNLQEVKPGWKLLLLDCLRPRSVQRKLYEYVFGTDQQKYVANPDRGSIHNYGFAVDLTLVDENEIEVDMGTEFDSFTKLAQPRLEKQMLTENQLTQAQHANRLILRNSMVDAGFRQLSFEWWHYDAANASTVRKNYQILE
ncbi:MAG: M15 family metallopeptidase [Leptospirales bacterium]